MVSEKFNAYEFIGVAAPGSIVLFGLYALFWLPEHPPEDGLFSLGDFGVFIILAFAMGHLVQAIGNWLEDCYWKLRGGWPTNRAIGLCPDLLSESQLKRLKTAIFNDFGVDMSIATAKDWWSITKEINSRLLGLPSYERVASFNRTYGLMRGLFAGFLTMAVIVLVTQPDNHQLFILLFVFALLAMVRMERFGQHYARELFVVYLSAGNTAPVTSSV